MRTSWEPEFDALVREHQAMVYSLALRMTADRFLAEEVAQDVFLEMERNLGKLSSADHARFWLRRVAMNRSADALRRRRVRRIDQWQPIERDLACPEAGAATPMGARLEALVMELPEAQRAAILLRYQEEMTPEEIAQALGEPLATVKSRLQRALKELRAQAQSRLKEFLRGA